MLDAFAIFVVAVAVSATLAPVLRDRSWWIRCFDFPRMQIAVVGAAGLVLHVAAFDHSLADYLVAAAGLAAVGRQAYLIQPYTRLARTEVVRARRHDPENRIRLLVANVWQPNRRAAELEAIIRRTDPDVVLLLETDGWWDRQMAGIARTHPYVVARPQDNCFGMHLYSRLELLSPQVRYLVQDDVPSIRTDVRLRSGHLVELYCVHPAPPGPTANEESIERDAELLMVGRAIRPGERPVIVTGDLNDVAWSRTTRRFRRIGRLLDPRVGRGRFSTFHARYWFMRWPLDHLFHSDDFTLVSISRLPYFGSDHFPIHVALQRDPQARDRQEPVEADAEDRSLARRTIHRAGIRRPSGGQR